MLELGSLIIKLREEKNISQTQLAKKLGVQRSTICLYESGKRFPSYDILINLADYFSVSIDYLLGRTDARNNILLPNSSLTLREQELIDLFRSINTKNQNQLIAFAKGLSVGEKQYN